MGQVTAYTAAKTLALINESITAAVVTNGILYLTTRGGTVINAGSVVGPQGATGGISQATLDAAILEATNNHGRGLIAIDKLATTPAVIAPAVNTWVDIAGLSVSLTPVVGRSYQFDMTAGLRVTVSGANPTARISLAIRDNDATGAVIVRAVGSTDSSTWLVSMTGSRKITAPSAWNANRGYKLSYYVTTNEYVTVAGADYEAQLSITDLGNL